MAPAPTEIGGNWQKNETLFYPDPKNAHHVCFFFYKAGTNLGKWNSTLLKLALITESATEKVLQFILEAVYNKKLVYIFTQRGKA